MLKLIIRLSVLWTGLCYATSTSNSDVQQSQMTSLSERVNQMINSIYTPSLLSKSAPSSPTTSPSSDSPTTYESPSYAYSSYPAPATVPQILYLPSPPTPAAVSPPNPTCYLDTGLQPVDYTYPVKSNPYPRAAYPSPFTYDYNYSPIPYPFSPYPSFSYPPTYPCQYPPIPKPSPYMYPDYPVPTNQQIPLYPPVSNSPPYHPPVLPHPTSYTPPPYPTPYHSAPPPYPTPSVQPPPFYSHLPYPNHSEALPQPRYP